MSEHPSSPTPPLSGPTPIIAISPWRRAIHWLSALLVIALLAIGLWMTRADVSSPQAVADNIWRFSAHKTIGVCVLILTIVRLISMRFGSGFTHSVHSPLESFVARAVQGYFLTALIILPATGLLIHYYAGSGAPIWGLPAGWLHNDTPDPGQVDSMVGVHHFLAWGMLLGIGLHMAGAIKHHVVDKDATLLRMLGRSTRGDTDGAKSVAHDDGQHSSARHAKVGQWLGVAAAFVLATAGAMFHEHDHADASPAAVMTNGNGDYISIDDSSTLNINAVQEGESFNARFERFQVTVTLDGQQVPRIIDVSIDSGSFVSGLGMRDDAVIGSDWLDAKAFPVSTYTTTSIGENANGEFKYVGDGQLTIRERSAPVKIEFSWTVDAADATRRQLQGRATFDRLALDLGRGEFSSPEAAGKLIQVEFDVMLDQRK